MNLDHHAIIAAEKYVRLFAKQTPLVRSEWLSRRSGAEVFLKLESEQDTGSFKLRGAANKLVSLNRRARDRGVITASNGNHALAVATMARNLGFEAEVLVSATIDEAKLRKIEQCGAKARKLSGDCLDAEKIAREEAFASGRTYISPYNDVEVIAGQGTIALEIRRQQPDVEAVFASVGGGGLIGGIGIAMKGIDPGVQMVGCWPENSAALKVCLERNEIVDVPELPTLSTSTAGGIEPGAVTLELARRVVDRRIAVTEHEILEALRVLARHDGLVVEGAAGVAVAGFLRIAPEFAGKTVAIVICGGNVSAEVAAMIRAST